MKNSADKIFDNGVDADLVGPLLAVPFPVSALSLRPGSGGWKADADSKWPADTQLNQVMTYFSKPHAMDELDRRFGATNWRMELDVVSTSSVKDQDTATQKDNTVIKATLSIKTSNGWITRDEIGQGTVKFEPVAATTWDYATRKNIPNIYKKYELKAGGQEESAKAAATDAFRRACAAIGLGRLYYNKSKNIYHPVAKGFFMFGKRGNINYGSAEDLLKELGYSATSEEVEAKIDELLEVAAKRREEKKD